ncbi:hypothetical protein E4T56_gene16378 [Termitomyces sp. T112]|nr:hypothetical protein C0989_009398 [Termitomyces sp. Mn162]KAG5716638.1 hypothetical protein E4T56_gene16378 [Termitomyces sp. T112]
MHTLIQYLFGWNNSHPHEFDVYTHEEMYKDKKKIGQMKKYGHTPDYLDWIYESSDPEREKYFWDLTSNNRAAFYHVVMSSGKARKPGWEFDGAGRNYQEKVQDYELTLDMIWNVSKKDNLSNGVCKNTELGIVYEYDLGASWVVHITLDSQEHFFTISPPSNLPVVVKAAGAPPIEDACGDVPGELEAEDKKINPSPP